MCIACNPGMSAIIRHAGSRRDFLQFMGSATASVLAATTIDPMAALAQSAAGDGPADVIFKGGPILTLGGGAPRATAIAVRGNRILAIGDLQDVEAYGGPKTRIVDLAGRTLMPGLIDPHMHSIFVMFEDWIDVSPITTPTFEKVQAKLREGAGKAKEGEWIRAQQFDPSITTGARVPTLAELDALAPNNPFFMIESNGHIAYANSTALRLAGVTRNTQDPPQSRFGRDDSGALTGRLEEPAAFTPFIMKMPQPTALEMRARIRRMLDRSASVGCTSLHDCGIGMQSGSGDLAVLGAVMADNPPVRYRGMLVSTAMDEWEKMALKPGRGNDRFSVGGIKAWADGSNQAQTGYQRENYLGTNGRGALNYTLEQLTDAIRRAHAGGWQVGVHANGDAAIDTTIEAYATVLKDSPRGDHRHRIEHCSVLHPEQMAKMKEYGLSPSFLIGHIRWWGKAFRDRLLGPERARFYDPCASALASGLRISLHSDWNVTPIEPLRYVEDAAARVMHEGGEVFFPEERIPTEAALRAVTLDAAWQCHMDDKVGSLEPGKLADFVILEKDPTAADATEISKIKVSATWMDGEQRYSA